MNRLLPILTLMFCVLAFTACQTSKSDEENKTKKFQKEMQMCLDNLYLAKENARVISKNIADNWHEYIWDDYHYFNLFSGSMERYSSSTYNYAYCYDINDVVYESVKHYFDVGLYDDLDKYYKKADSLIRHTQCPSKYKESLNDIKDLHIQVGELVSLSKEPTGNYQTFTSLSRELNSDIERKIERISLDYSFIEMKTDSLKWERASQWLGHMECMMSKGLKTQR